MAARSIASLTIAFGLVSIPVKLYSATQPSGGVSFNLLHRACGSRLRQQYLCVKEDVVVERADMVKGYEFAKDRYVTFSPDELRELEAASTQTVEVSEFLPIGAIDPVYYDKAYYLAPDKGGAKPYSLFAEAMRRSERCAIGRYAARGKQYIVLLRPADDVLVMQQLLYADEVRASSELEIAPAEVREPELKLAMQLIEQISSSEFHPEAYEDTVKQRIEAAIERKVEGKEIAVSAAPAVTSGAQVIDLMQALRASLGKQKAPQAAGAAAAEPRNRKPPKRAAVRAESPPQRKTARK
ncbi:MAG: Ku protein [Burkholderiales bacterium]|nr:Ku protein [Burkholderiales bacterium]